MNHKTRSLRPVLFSVWLVALMCVLFGNARVSAQTIYDLRRDWSDTANPNGVWAYRSGDQVAPHISNWPHDTFESPQGGWVSGGTFPFLFRSSSAPRFPQLWSIGDIIVHTHGGYIGAANGPGNFIWTSPLAGTVTIVGGVWEGRRQPDLAGGWRGNQWSLYLNNKLISQGRVIGGDGYTRDKPFTFDLGSGGAKALLDIRVAVGDVVKLELVRTTSEGDYVGVKFSVIAVPEVRTYVASVAVSRASPDAKPATPLFRPALEAPVVGDATVLANVPATIGIDLVPALKLTGGVGSTYRLDYADSLDPNGSWTALTNLTLLTSPQFYSDYSAIGQPARFYRLVPLP